MPDIFVPIDTTRYTDFHRKVVAQGLVNKVAVQYIDKNRTDLKKKYSNFEKFKKSFEISDELLDKLKQLAEKDKIVVDSTQFETSKNLIKLQLKALVARDLWEVNEYYQIIDSENESLLKAIEILKTKGAYEKIINSL
jgi:carboxyl-terminal processing protease